MIRTINSIFGRVIWTGEAETVKDAIHAAIASGANLSGANLCPVVVLLSFIDNVSPELCALLMRYDAANHPRSVEAFSVWAAGGACPYTSCRVQRVANFQEQREHWNPDAPVLSAFELMKLVLREKCANSDYHEVVK